MKTVLNVLLDVLLAGSMAFFILVLIQMVVHEEHPRERLYQALALAAGALAALGASASGVGLAHYTVNALTGARPGGAAFTVVAVIIPGGLAAAFGWYLVRMLRTSTKKAQRLVAFVGMLTAVAGIEIFAQATQVKGVELGAAAIPNASFVLGLILSVIFLAPEPEEDSYGATRFAAVSRILRRKAPQRLREFVPSASVSEASPSPWAED
jgi:hypothetical protein